MAVLFQCMTKFTTNKKKKKRGGLWDINIVSHIDQDDYESVFIL